jgi:hypothetical protein
MAAMEQAAHDHSGHTHKHTLTPQEEFSLAVADMHPDDDERVPVTVLSGVVRCSHPPRPHTSAINKTSRTHHL